LKKTKKIWAMVVILICSFALSSSMARADEDDYYQGHRGHWKQHNNQWQFHDVDGNQYRRHGKSWDWYDGRRHSWIASEYHNRAPGDNRSYQQFKNDQGH
jgi:hypothetical protein